MLSGFDFNQTSGPLQFNHPGGIASDGTNLVLADTFNNRVLIWQRLPTGNTPPDLVLGQADFTSNEPGTHRSQFNWPMAVAIAQGTLVVADTYNDRLLIWKTLPTTNGQAADIEIRGGQPGPQANDQRTFGWPWGVWTDGEKLVMTNTAGRTVLLWQEFPTTDDEAADLILKAHGDFGTPRTIASDGQRLLIGDHNAKADRPAMPGAQATRSEPNDGPGTFVWQSFPTRADQPYDFFIPAQGEWLKPALLPSGGLIAQSEGNLKIWHQFPDAATVEPDLILGTGDPARRGNFKFDGGDGSTITLAGTRIYISLYNGNKIVGYTELPTTADQLPDLVIGAPDAQTNTLDTNYIITNGVPASDGQHLFVSSDFDNKLFIWKNLPDESGAHPDLVLPYGGWDNDLFGSTFASVNQQRVHIWETLPLDGQKPDRIFEGKIGTITLQDVRGVAIDDRHFYLADSRANKVYIWEGLPSDESAPKFTLSVKEPYRLSTDGRYLVVASTLDNETGHIKIFSLADLSDAAQPHVVRHIPTNLPQHAIVAHGKFFLADTGFNRVLVWNSVTDYLASQEPQVILGAKDLQETEPEIGIDKLFWPAGLAFDGAYLWVGEFKFGNRLLRFSPHE